MEKNAVRFKLIDTIRGITVISMVIYHAMWDICNIFSVKMPRYSGTPGYVWQQSICITFIFISGFCSYLGKDKRKKLKRGFTVSLCGLVVTFVSLAFMEDTPIYFGILTFIGLMMLISAMLYKPLKYISPIPGAAVSLFLFIILKEVNTGFIGLHIGPLDLRLSLPRFMNRDMLTALIGFPPEGFFSADYFPLIPWCFLYLAAYFISAVVCGMGRIRFLEEREVPAMSFIGRHSLLIYMLHQPVIYLILRLIFA